MTRTTHQNRTARTANRKPRYDEAEIIDVVVMDVNDEQAAPRALTDRERAAAAVARQGYGAQGYSAQEYGAKRGYAGAAAFGQTAGGHGAERRAGSVLNLVA
ncbi:MAG: hypothetical protein AAF224_02750 [Pseudomonadota bacterium]